MGAFLGRVIELVARHIADAHAMFAGLFEQPLQSIVGALGNPDLFGASRLDRLEHGIDAVNNHQPRAFSLRPSATDSRTIGATRVPISSMLFVNVSCGNAPLLYLRSNRERPRVSTVLAIFFATVSGEPTQSAPPATSCSKSSRPRLGQPRSAPIRFIIRS